MVRSVDSMTRIHDLPWETRLALAAHLIERQKPTLPTTLVDQALLDQALAATDDTTRVFETTAALLTRLDPATSWRRTERDGTQYRVAVLAAILGCAPCPHLRHEGPQPAIAALAHRRLTCHRCTGTRRNPPPGEDDRCDFCGERGIRIFTAAAIQCGTILAVGDACHTCRLRLQLEEAS